MTPFGAADADSGPAIAERFRAMLALLLLGGGLLLAPLAIVGGWVRYELLDSARFSDLSHRLLEEEAVQEAIADRVVLELEREVPAYSTPAVESLVALAVREAVALPAFEPAFEASMASLHAQLVAGEPALVIDVNTYLPLVEARLASIDPRLAASLPPPGTIEPVVVASREEHDVAWRAVDTANEASLAALAGTTAGLAGAVVVARRRWGMGALAAGGAAAWALAIAVAVPALLASMTFSEDPAVEGVADRVAAVLGSGLARTAIVVAAVGAGLAASCLVGALATRWRR